MTKPTKPSMGERGVGRGRCAPCPTPPTMAPSRPWRFPKNHEVLSVSSSVWQGTASSHGRPSRPCRGLTDPTGARQRMRGSGHRQMERRSRGRSPAKLPVLTWLDNALAVLLGARSDVTQQAQPAGCSRGGGGTAEAAGSEQKTVAEKLFVVDEKSG